MHRGQTQRMAVSSSGAAGCTLRILTKKDVQPNETLADFYRVRSPQECLQICVDYQRGGSCLSAVYRDHGKCSLKSSSIAAATDSPNATWIIVYCGDGDADPTDGSGAADDTGNTGDTAFPPPTLGDGFTSQDNVKRDGATRVNVRWNQSIDQCIALCENEEGCAHVNYRKSSRGCFMLKDDGTLAGDSACTLHTLCAPDVCLLCAGRPPAFIIKTRLPNACCNMGSLSCRKPQSNSM